MSEMEQFFTRDVANEGIEVPLFLPNGKKSGHWIKIRGVDSDVFRAADVEGRRELASAMLQEGDEGKQTDLLLKSKRRVIGSLIIAWSFDEPLTPDNIDRLLSQAPQIADAIDQLASKRALFFANGSASSTSTLKQSSDSTSSPTDPDRATDPA